MKGEIRMIKMIKRNAARIATVFVATMMVVPSVLAASLTADTANFMAIMKFIATWTTYLGAGIAFFGAIQLAFGFRSDDAEGKNKGLRSMIAGIIVIAIGAAVQVFLDMGKTV